MQIKSIRKKFGYEGRLTLNPFRFSDPLLCKDLDLIFEYAQIYKLSIVLSTNGVGLTQKNAGILASNKNCIRKISISFIGSDKVSVQKYMGISLEKVLRNIKNICEIFPELGSIFHLSFRVVDNTVEEDQIIKDLKYQCENLGVKRTTIRDEWITNRVNHSQFDADGKPSKVGKFLQSPDSFTSGCSWGNKLQKRLEVMVNGDIVLCCDDAERNKVFGNVFTQSISEIWNGTLKSEREIIFSKSFNTKKNELICSTCSRAEWSKAQRL